MRSFWLHRPAKPADECTSRRDTRPRRCTRPMGIMYAADLAAQEYELLTADLVIVDECSMVDMRLAYALFQRLKPGAQLILVGDPDQLPSDGGLAMCSER